MNQREIYRVSLKTHLDAIYPTLFFAIVFLTVIVWERFDRAAIIILGIFYLIDLLPALVLHMEYWVKDHGLEVLIYTDKITVNKGDKVTIVKAEDIRKITLHQTPSHSQNSNMRFLTIGGYYFAHIYLKNGEDLILTSLLGQRLKVSLKKLKGVYFDEDVSLYNNLYRALD